MNPRLSAAAALLATLAGFSALWAGTDGWVAWTAESARRLSVLKNPEPLPPTRLRDINGHEQWLTGFDRPIVLMDFIYTQCASGCIAMGTTFRQLQRDLDSLELQDKVQLLSLTFDQARDGLPELTDYLSRFSADEEHWTAAKFEEEHALNAVLEQLGVVIIPGPTTGFVHNTAVYLVHHGRVVGIYGLDDKAKLLEDLEWRLTHG